MLFPDADKPVARGNLKSNDIINTLYTDKLISISLLKEARADNRNIQGISYRLLTAPLTQTEYLNLKTEMDGYS